MSNADNYTLSVIWGKFKIPAGDGSSATVERFCWHAIATHTRYITNSITVPTGWTDVTPDMVDNSSIECYAETWGGMSTKLSALATFWNE